MVDSSQSRSAAIEEIVREVARNGPCEAFDAGWGDCDEREAHDLMALGYKCLTCRASAALERGQGVSLPRVDAAVGKPSIAEAPEVRISRASISGLVSVWVAGVGYLTTPEINDLARALRDGRRV